jgi:hypothetical protein
MQTRRRSLVVCFVRSHSDHSSSSSLAGRSLVLCTPVASWSRSSSFLVPRAAQSAGPGGLSRAAARPLTSSMLTMSAALEACRTGGGSGGCASSHEAGSAEWDVLASAGARAWVGGYGGRSRALGWGRCAFSTTRRTGMTAAVRETQCRIASSSVHTHPELVHVTCHPLLTDAREASLLSHCTSHSQSPTPLSCDRRRGCSLLVICFHNAHCATRCISLVETPSYVSVVLSRP